MTKFVLCLHDSELYTTGNLYDIAVVKADIRAKYVRQSDFKIEETPQKHKAHEHTCAFCHKTFWSIKRLQKYCSPECHTAASVKWITCKHCGNLYRAHASGRRNKHFCSMPCKLQYQSIHQVGQPRGVMA